MKKKLFIFLAALFLSTASLSATAGKFAIGAAVGSPTFIGNILIAMGNFVALDIDFGLSNWGWRGYDPGEAQFFAAVDFLLWQPKIVDSLSFFVGVGPRMVADGNNFSLGARVPLGIDWQAHEKVSVFFKLVPGVAFQFIHRFDVAFSFDWNLGVRYIIN